MPQGHSISRRRWLQAVTSAAGTFSAAGSASSAQESEPGWLGGLFDYVSAALERWQLPGLALAVVQDGKTLFSGGHGVRDTATGAKVNEETVFPIASCTKAFTAAALAKLVDAGQLAWDDPIARHLPAFQLAEAEATRRVTIRHALAHRTGLPTANMLWRSGEFDRAEILARLRRLELIGAPGEKFLYNNYLYLILGMVAERISGRPWEDFLRDELILPLGMAATFVDGASVPKSDPVAAPHAVIDDRLRRVDKYCPDVIAPAGAIHSTVRDMAHWLQLHLGNGTRGGRRIISQARLDEMHASQRRDGRPAQARGEPRAPMANYGLGWFFNEHAGHRVIEHSGAQRGFVSWVALMPHIKLGLVILANGHRTGLNAALRSWIFDAALGRPQRDWSELVRADYANGYQRLLREAKTRFKAQRQAAKAHSRPLAEYAGTYASQLYGSLHVRLQDGRLNVQLGTRFNGSLEHWENESFRATFAEPLHEDWLVTFSLQDSLVAGLRAKEAPWAPAWYDDAEDLGEFLRVPPENLRGTKALGGKERSLHLAAVAAGALNHW